jgi:HD-GYP domain-containing protein (c-di-GMP phosphodiesterase class II)
MQNPTLTKVESIRDHRPPPPLPQAGTGTLLSTAPSTPTRLPILYVILSVLLAISVIPMYFYSTRLEAINRDRLKTNEMLLQNTVTRSLAEDIAQRRSSLHMMLSNLSYAVQVTSGSDISAQQVERPELRALLENFVSSSDDLAYATLLNSEAKGISAGRILPDAFLQRELERAFAAARENRAYTGQALTLGSGREARTVILVSTPVLTAGRFLGMIACVEDLEFLVRRLRDSSTGSMMTYVVDGQGRLVAASSPEFATGQDMTSMEIVRKFVAGGGKAQVVETKEFTVMTGKTPVETLGTYSPVNSLDWAVVGQKPQREAYRGVYEMQRAARLLAVFSVLLSIAVSFYAARRISTPLRTLAETSRAIARGDFSQRIHLNSHTEIGELAQTFNTMSDELEHFVQDLRHAAEENRDLFLNSIQMLAGAVDEKDPYTRGHSDRVTRYSVMIARELGLPETMVETVRISAQLHDVGKIGIEDRILKKPGALTPEEFEIMKTHTTKGANILRGVPQLAEMLPGIELHHESLDGRGYPRGLQGDEIPLLPRIIAVADTFDAVTTNRPYQQAHEPVDALQILHKLKGKRLDEKAVDAFTAVFERGEIRVPRKVVIPPIAIVEPAPDDVAATLETTRI